MKHFLIKSFVKDGLQELKAQYPIKKVFIEKPFMFFGSEAQQQKLWQHCKSLMAQYRGYVTRRSSITNLLYPYASKLNEIKVEKGKDTKKQILQWVLDNCPDFSVEYTHKGNPNPSILILLMQ